jgi:hypothetical protein
VLAWLCCVWQQHACLCCLRCTQPSAWLRCTPPVQAGFIRGHSEREVLLPSVLAAPSSRTFTLCPYDRAECRGALMALSFKTSANDTVVLGYRSMPFWQDVPVDGGRVLVEHARENLAGVSVIYGVATEGQELVRSLLDFNTQFATFPDSLPGHQLVRSCALCFTADCAPFSVAPYMCGVGRSWSWRTRSNPCPPVATGTGQLPGVLPPPAWLRLV